MKATAIKIIAVKVTAILGEKGPSFNPIQLKLCRCHTLALTTPEANFFEQTKKNFENVF